MALPAQDDFNRADESTLGGNWTTQNGRGNMALVSNAANGSGSFISAAGWNADAFANDQYSQCILPTINISGIAVRGQTSGDDWYFLEVKATTVAFFKYVAGSRTAIGSEYSHSASTTLVQKLEVVGTTLKYYEDGVEITSQTDSAHSSGRAGIWANNTSSPIDDWEGGDVAVGGVGIEIFRRRIEGY